ncbi:hypothetical protein ACI2J9_03590 [Pseudomonas fulva]|uniref:hypothetical protein n=1 Tax=Pseudomonas fulva TaxID=47880 RepID=UPI00384E098E
MCYFIWFNNCFENALAMGKQSLSKLGAFAASYLIPGLAVVFSVVSLTQVYDQFVGYRKFLEDRPSSSSSPELELLELRARFEAFERTVIDLPSKTREMIEGSSGAKNNLDYVLIDKRISELSNRLGALEAAISDSPEKALSVPMLRKDQAALSREVDASRIAVKSEIDRLNDQFKWILNGIAAALVLMLGAALSMLGNVYLKSAQKE